METRIKTCMYTYALYGSNTRSDNLIVVKLLVQRAVKLIPYFTVP